MVPVGSVTATPIRFVPRSTPTTLTKPKPASFMAATASSILVTSLPPATATSPLPPPPPPTMRPASPASSPASSPLSLATAATTTTRSPSGVPMRTTAWGLVLAHGLEGQVLEQVLVEPVAAVDTIRRRARPKSLAAAFTCWDFSALSSSSSAFCRARARSERVGAAPRAWRAAGRPPVRGWPRRPRPAPACPCR